MNEYKICGECAHCEFDFATYGERRFICEGAGPFLKTNTDKACECFEEIETEHESEHGKENQQ